MNEPIIKLENIGCKFCSYTFSILDLLEYKHHLWRFHRDELQEKLTEVVKEINRIEHIPK